MAQRLLPGASYLQSLFGLEGKLAVVTGGSSGIGRAMARALGMAGASVVLVARRAGPLQDAVKQMSDEGIRVASLALDVCDTEALQRTVLEQHGLPDILVNAAGINPRPHLDDLSRKVWDDIIAINLTAPFALGQAFGPAMARRGSGRIINLASQQAFSGIWKQWRLRSVKAGLVALTRSQAEAWSPKGVLCNAVAPGLVETPMTEAVFAETDKAAKHAARAFTGRNGVPRDFEGIAVYLASEASSSVTGQVFFVDGGYSAS